MPHRAAGIVARPGRLSQCALQRRTCLDARSIEQCDHGIQLGEPLRADQAIGLAFQQHERDVGAACTQVQADSLAHQAAPGGDAGGIVEHALAPCRIPQQVEARLQSVAQQVVELPGRPLALQAGDERVPLAQPFERGLRRRAQTDALEHFRVDVRQQADRRQLAQLPRVDEPHHPLGEVRRDRRLAVTCIALRRLAARRRRRLREQQQPARPAVAARAQDARLRRVHLVRQQLDRLVGRERQGGGVQDLHGAACQFVEEDSSRRLASQHEHPDVVRRFPDCRGEQGGELAACGMGVVDDQRRGGGDRPEEGTEEAARKDCEARSVLRAIAGNAASAAQRCGELREVVERRRRIRVGLVDAIPQRAVAPFGSPGRRERALAGTWTRSDPHHGVARQGIEIGVQPAPQQRPRGPRR